MGFANQARGAIAVALAVAACGGFGKSNDQASSGGKVSLSFLVDNQPTTVKTAEALASAFHTRNPDVTIKVASRPGGSDGDNIVKTRLSTGTMNDVFEYNSGSLFQAISPQKNLVSLNDRPWVKDLDKSFTPSVSAGGQVYGAPWGSSFGGGILYNKKVFKKLGLKVPTT